MIAYALDTIGPYRNELATVVREVNARHREAGGQEIVALREAWISLDRSLALAAVAGDNFKARQAVRRYRTQALSAIEGQS